MNLSDNFRDALAWAFELHRNQFRKGTCVPYISHLLSVAALVIEDGGSEEEAIAALLHDAVEDQGGQPTLASIRERFGDRVAAIVDSCSDTDQSPKPPWRDRKEKYLAHLEDCTESAQIGMLRVSLADKVHNARDLLHAYRQHGEAFWDHFNGKKDGTLWYYDRLVKIFQDRYPGPLTNELDRTVLELKTLSGKTVI
jgi:(p)ppGpp synthase/HD superfamily hydrolase